MVRPGGDRGFFSFGKCRGKYRREEASPRGAFVRGGFPIDRHIGRDEVASSGGRRSSRLAIEGRAFRRWGVARAGRGDGSTGHCGRHRFARMFGAYMEVRSAASPDFHIRFDVPAAIGRFRSFQHRHLRNCLVVGGGISGSTLAHNLRRNHGLDVLLCESQDYLGGNVASAIITDDGGTFVYERGPNSFATTASIVRISHELGIQDDLVFADESLPPWVNHGGKIHPLPKGNGGKGPRGQLELLLGPNGIAKFAIAGDLLSWPGKVRAGVGAFLGHIPPPPDSREETIKEWVIRILGDEVFYRIIDPFVSGVYAGDPETLRSSLGRGGRTPPIRDGSISSTATRGATGGDCRRSRTRSRTSSVAA